MIDHLNGGVRWLGQQCQLHSHRIRWMHMHTRITLHMRKISVKSFFFYFRSTNMEKWPHILSVLVIIMIYTDFFWLFRWISCIIYTYMHLNILNNFIIMCIYDNIIINNNNKISLPTFIWNITFDYCCLLVCYLFISGFEVFEFGNAGTTNSLFIRHEHWAGSVFCFSVASIQFRWYMTRLFRLPNWRIDQSIDSLSIDGLSIRIIGASYIMRNWSVCKVNVSIFYFPQTKYIIITDWCVNSLQVKTMLKCCNNSYTIPMVENDCYEK